MGIKYNNKDVIGVVFSGHPIVQIYNSNIIIYTAQPTDYDIDLDVMGYNGQYGSFKLNNRVITPTSERYQANLEDFGFDEITSFSFNSSNVEHINKFPDTSKVTSLNGVFSYSSLKSLDLTDWNWDSLVDAGNVFQSIQRAKRLTAPDAVWDKIPSIAALYYSDEALLNAEIKNPDRYTDLSNTFNGCVSLSSITCNWNAFRNVTSCQSLFNNCGNLDFHTMMTSTNSSFKSFLNMSAVENTSAMFAGCNLGDSFNSANLSQWAMNNATDMSYMFASTTCSYFNFTTGWDWWRCANFSHMFDGSTVQEINMNNKDFQSAEDMSYMFANCTSLRRVNLYGINWPESVNVEGMFDNCGNLQSVEVGSCDAYNLLKPAIQSAGLSLSILDVHSECGSGGDDTGTTEVSSILEFEWNPELGGGRTEVEYMINNEYFYAYESPVRVDVKNLGIDQVTNINYLFGYDDTNRQMITRVNALPDLSHVDTLEWVVPDCNNCKYVNFAGQDFRNIQSAKYLVGNIGYGQGAGGVVDFRNVQWPSDIIDKMNNWEWHSFVSGNLIEVKVDGASCELTQALDNSWIDLYRMNSEFVTTNATADDCNKCMKDISENYSDWKVVVSTSRTVPYDVYIEPKDVKRSVDIQISTPWCNGTNFNQNESASYSIVYDCDGPNYTGSRRTVNATVTLDDGTELTYSFIQRAEGEEENITWHQLTFDTPRDIPMSTFRITKNVTNGASGFYFAQFNSEPNQDYGDNMGWSICPEQQNLIDDGNWINFDEYEGDVFEYTMTQDVYWTGAEENACLEAIEYATFD